VILVVSEFKGLVFVGLFGLFIYFSFLLLLWVLLVGFEFKSLGPMGLFGFLFVGCFGCSCVYSLST
jgi:hypothetical protein